MNHDRPPLSPSSMALEPQDYTRPPPGSAALAAGHFQPVQIFFDLMEGGVADLVVGAHGNHLLPRGLKGTLVQFAVCWWRAVLSRAGFGLVIEMRRELLAHEFGHGRLVAVEAGESRAQRPCAGDAHFVTHRIVVLQLERAQ